MKIDMLGVRSIAAPVAAIALSAWLGVSNHCVLGAAAPEKGPVPSDRCPFHSHPANPQPPEQSDAQPCCKILRAIPPPGVKSCTPAVVHLADAHPGFAGDLVFSPSKISADPDTLDTGPPGAFSFAELILQRSMPALAPPILA
jgi:hypothetical protein